MHACCTQNAARGSKDRNPLPLALRARMMEVQVPDFQHGELQAILQQRRDMAAGREDAAALERLYFLLQEGPSPGAPPLLAFTMREAIKVLRRKQQLQCGLPEAALSLLLTKVQPGQEAALVQRMASLGGAWAALRPPRMEDYVVEQLPAADQMVTAPSPLSRRGRRSSGSSSSGGVRFAMLGARGAAKVQVVVPAADLHRSRLLRSLTAASLPIPATLRRTLVHIAFAAASSGQAEPVLLQGPTCHKSAAVRVWADITGRSTELTSMHLTAGEF